jgi:hypothetical protein
MFSYNINLSYDEEEMMAELLSQHGEQIIQKTNAIYDGIKTK